jgi:hypothetical protein
MAISDDVYDDLIDEMCLLAMRSRLPTGEGEESWEPIEIDLDKDEVVAETSAIICKDYRTGKLSLAGKREFSEPEVIFETQACDRAGESHREVGTYHTHPYPTYIAPSAYDLYGSLKRGDRIACTGAVDVEKGVCQVICFEVDQDRLLDMIMERCGDDFLGDKNRDLRCRSEYEGEVITDLTSLMKKVDDGMRSDGWTDETGNTCPPNPPLVHIDFKSAGKRVGYMNYYGKTEYAEEYDRRILEILGTVAAVSYREMPCSNINLL